MTPAIDIKLPNGWQDLSQAQLGYVYSAIALADGILSASELQLCIALKIAGIKVIDAAGRIFRTRNITMHLSDQEIAMIAGKFTWLAEIPQFPVRLESIDRTKALDQRLTQLSFESYIALDNLYQGVISGAPQELIDKMTEILYPGIKITNKNRKISRINTFIWWTSFKAWAAQRWSFFLRPGNNSKTNGFSTGSPNLHEAVAMQIRALTKGDITKEKLVRKAPAHSALAELNALAREAEELERMKKN